MYIKQFQMSDFVVFSYLLGCQKTKEAVVIDPAGDVEIILDEAAKHSFGITKIINTHGHFDHTMGNGDLKQRTNAAIIIHEADARFLTAPSMMYGGRPSPCADFLVKDGDTIHFGEEGLLVIHTPGHTPGGICLYTRGHIFTGDTLFVEGVGRTDFPGGSWPALLRSITKKIFSLPDETVVFPGHNYGHRPTSTIGYEKTHNPFVNSEVS
jgi:glyoxylase-like metal-dependent hydrolase (beta-lactamase superfamily II)